MQAAKASASADLRSSDIADKGQANVRDEAGALIEVIIGTKAQYIKTAPVLRELDRRNIKYRLVDTGQHAGLSPMLRADLKVQEPAFIFAKNGNVATISQAAFWAMKIFADIVFRPQKLKNEILSPDSRICLIHGDTPSTLLSLLIAKRAGKTVGHIEAGLRSFNIFKPFPEELVRIICMRFSDYLFSPSQTATTNLHKMGVKGKIVEIGRNTNVEAVQFARRGRLTTTSSPEKYVVFTVHRVETIFNTERLQFVISTAEKIAEKIPVKFILHDPTLKRLQARNLLNRLKGNPRISLSRLAPHNEFIDLVAGSEFVVTDGGSIQEECYFLNVPCLIMRTETERDEGLAENAELSMFDDDIVDRFTADYRSYKAAEIAEQIAPSRIIVDELETALRVKSIRSGSGIIQQ